MDPNFVDSCSCSSSPLAGSNCSIALFFFTCSAFCIALAPCPYFPRLVTDHDPARGSGHEVFQNFRVESSRVESAVVRLVTGGVESGQEVFNYHGSSRANPDLHIGGLPWVVWGVVRFQMRVLRRRCTSMGLART